MDGIKRITGTSAPLRHFSIAQSEQPSAPPADQLVRRSAQPSRVRAFTAEAFPPLGPTRLASDIELPLVLSGLAAGRAYVVTMVRPHPTSADMSLVRELQATADAAGKVDLGLLALRDVLGREPTREERRYGGTVALKLMGEKPNAFLTPRQASFVPAMAGGDRVLISAQPAAGEGPLPPAVLARQEFTANAEGVTRTDLDPARDGMVGYTLLPPNSAGKTLPTVVVWGGSGGNIPNGWASYLASQGFAVVALRYFTYDAKDPSVGTGAIHHLIDELPLERFGRAIAWAKAQPFCGELSVLGESRGGEAALLVAQHLGDRLGVRNVVPLRPLDFAVGSKINGADFKGEPELSSWTLGGKPLPFAAKGKGVMQPEEALAMARASGTLRYYDWYGEKVPVAPLRPGFEAYEPGTAVIDVGGYRGRIVSVGAVDDAMWPSDVAVRRVAEQRRGHAGDVLINVRGAGHYTEPGRRSTNILGEDYVPIQTTGGPPLGFLCPNGGTAGVNALYDVLNQLVVSRALKGESTARLPFSELVERP